MKRPKSYTCRALPERGCEAPAAAGVAAEPGAAPSSSAASAPPGEAAAETTAGALCRDSRLAARFLPVSLAGEGEGPAAGLDDSPRALLRLPPAPLFPPEEVAAGDTTAGDEAAALLEPCRRQRPCLQCHERIATPPAPPPPPAPPHPAWRCPRAPRFKLQHTRKTGHVGGLETDDQCAPSFLFPVLPFGPRWRRQ